MVLARSTVSVLLGAFLAAGLVGACLDPEDADECVEKADNRPGLNIRCMPVSSGCPDYDTQEALDLLNAGCGVDRVDQLVCGPSFDGDICCYAWRGDFHDCE